MRTYTSVQKLGIGVLVLLLMGFLGGSQSTHAQTPLDESFTFQGQLVRDGTPVTDTCDIRFALFDAATSGTQIGPVRTLTNVAVVQGTFQVNLNFGSDAFRGDARFLEVSVQCSGETRFTLLQGRVPLRATPYALFAPQSPWQGLLGIPTGFADGVDDGITRLQPGPGLTSQGITETVTLALDTDFSDARYWQAGGNAGVAPAGRVLGTTDGITLTLIVSNTAALRLEATESVPNLAGGSAQNNIASGVRGATIAGGGEVPPSDDPFPDPGEETVDPNRIFDDYGTIGGGSGNVAGSNDSNLTNAPFTAVGGGQSNTASGFFAVVAGGRGNRSSAFLTTVGGGGSNHATGDNATVGGGVSNDAIGVVSTIAGGSSNTVGGEFATVGGGFNNTASANHTTVSGGGGNTAGGELATVSGGRNNTASANNTTISGGQNNSATEFGATVGGGNSNRATSNVTTVAGGASNTASGSTSTVGGGSRNTAEGNFTTISGGVDNRASGQSATVAGDQSNTASGDFSFAAGLRAIADDDGSFVWADSIGGDLFSPASNTFVVRASSGTTFFSNSTETTGVRLFAGGGAWNSLSDRNAKEHFTPVDSRDILSRLVNLPITTWNYRSQDTTIRHIGPVAQDFAAVFAVGENDTTINTIDADGVALAAIQGLHSLVQEQDAQIVSQQARIDELEARLQALEQRLGVASAPAVTSVWPGISVALLVLALVGLMQVRYGSKFQK